MSQELKQRTKKFALDVMRLCSILPKRAETKHIFDQVLRSASSVAANYRAALRARSSAEFLSRLGVVEEECDETQFWLELQRDGAQVLPGTATASGRAELERLIREAEELLRIVIAAKKTTRSKLAK